MDRTQFLSMFLIAATLVVGLAIEGCGGGRSSPTAPEALSEPTAGSGQQDSVSSDVDDGDGTEEGPGIDIEKATNGVDADLPPGPTIPIGDPVTWSYVVTNIGDVGLIGIVVEDDQEGVIPCPAANLDPGQSMTCSASGIAIEGQYENSAEVRAATESETERVRDRDDSHYFGGGETFAAVQIIKRTNGEVADVPRGPIVLVGDPVEWTYEVENIGSETITGVTVSDSDPMVTITCPSSQLAPDQMMTCSASGIAEEGQYENVGSVEGTFDSTTVSDTNSSHYFGSAPAVSLTKRTDGEDAKTPPGPTLDEGCTVTWTYEVENKGNIELENIVVTDDQGVAVSCPQDSLPVDGSMVCTATGTVILGPYANLGTVSATDPAGNPVDATDTSHYFGENIPPSCSDATASADILWPPNHKLETIEILNVLDPCGDPATITIDSISQDEPTNGLGDGDTSPDGFGVGSSAAQVRAERSGTGNGRVYHIAFTADDGKGQSCSGEVTVGVPHDRKDVPIDDGALYDSTQP